MNDFESDRTDMQSLESQLARLKPGSPPSTAAFAEMMYRCGFEAARAAEVGPRLQLAARANTAWQTFGWGHLSGLATAVFGLLLWTSAFTGPSQTALLAEHSAPVTSPATEEAVAVEFSRDSEPAVSDTSAANQQLAGYVPAGSRRSWWELHVAGDAIAQPVRPAGDGFLDREVLSLAAQHTWASMLMPANATSETSPGASDAGTAESDRTLRAYPHSLETLNDLL